MKIHPTVALSLVLLVMMGGAGAASGIWGYALGREALKSVTQPDIRPTQPLPSNQTATSDDNEELTILLEEEDILQQVNDIVSGKVPDEAVASPTEAEAAAAPENTDASPQVTGINEALPVQGRDGDVTLAVTEANQQEGSLILSVNLTNEGEESVRFLYSFLAVTDDQGRALSAITDGLPSELPPNGQAFEGTIKIPLALIEDSQSLALTLSDYPDQRLNLSLADIPVMQ